MSRNVTTNYRYQEAMPQRTRDVLGRLKVSVHQNVYEADFEYGTQPLRWEQLIQTADGVSGIQSVPSSGGVRMRVGTSVGDVTIRQSRPYHRYQPGKTLFMATGLNLGTAIAGNVQRVGFFDDSNGVFFEQGQSYPANPYGVYVVVRSDAGGPVQETRVGLDQWSGDQSIISKINFSNIQMFWIEFGWYGAGATRFGFWFDGEPFIAHQIGWGNYNNTVTGTGGQQTPWARTGNLPVRYEQRNLTGTSAINDMYHYGVSVIVEGQRDEQRGFTYSYGLPNTAPTVVVNSGTTRKPVLSIRGRQMGTIEYGNIYGRNDFGASPTSTGTIANSFSGYISGNTLYVTSTGTGVITTGTVLTGIGVATTSSSNGIVTPFTVITGNLTGTGLSSTSSWIVSNSQRVGSATSPISFTGSGQYMTVTGNPFTSNQWLGRQIYLPNNGNQTVVTTNSTGTVGYTTATVANASGIYLGSIVTGTGINSNGVPTYVTLISGTTVTLSFPLSASISASALTFTNYWGSGAIGRVVYNTSNTIYWCDPVLQNALPSIPNILTTPVTQSYSSGGASGSYTVTLGGNAGVTIGMSVSGTGVAPGAQVSNISGNVITMSLPATGQISGTLTFNTGYIIGLSNRGQILPKRLLVSQSANTQVLVEVIASTPTNPTVLNGANFNAVQYLGSVYSFAERDVTASTMSGGEVVFAFVLSSGSGVQDLDFSYFFPLYNNIRGNGIDTLTVAISAPSGQPNANVGANLIAQEAMS